MPKRAKFDPVKVSRGKWRLNIPAGYSESGERERRFFKTRDEAEEHADTLKAKREEFGAQAKSIRPSLAEAATKAEALLRPFGISLLEAAERIVAMENRAKASRPVSEAVAEFEATKESKSGARQREVRYLREAMTELFGDRMLADVGGKEIAEAFHERFTTPSTYNRRIDDAARFIRWAAHKLRQWCDASETEYFEKREEANRGKPMVMTPKQCKTLLTVAEEHYPDTVPAFVLMLFMGCRPSEVEKMSGADITEDGVTVPDESESGEKSKTGRRFIHMTPTVAAWLAKYPVGESVTPPNWKRKWDAVRRMAGWGVSAGLLKGEKWNVTDELPKWTADILRHTAATISINSGKPLSTLIFEHGHSQGEVVLKKHYHGRMTQKQTLEILSIGPKGEKIETTVAA